MDMYVYMYHVVITSPHTHTHTHTHTVTHTYRTLSVDTRPTLVKLAVLHYPVATHVVSVLWVDGRVKRIGGIKWEPSCSRKRRRRRREGEVGERRKKISLYVVYLLTTISNSPRPP